MKINMKEWAQDIVNSPQRTAFPVSFYPGLELVQKSVTEVLTNPEAQFKVMEALVERYPSFAGIITAIDLTAEPEAFGCEIKFSEDDVPQVISSIVSDRESAEKLEVPSLDAARIPVFLKTAELAAQKITTCPVFPELMGPFSVASQLLGMKKIMRTTVKDPETLHIVLDKCTQFLIEYAKAFKEAGANGLIIAEPTAGLLSPKHCDEFSSEYIKKLVDEVQDDYFLIILHNCGFTKQLVGSMASTGAKVLHFGNAVDMVKDIMPQIPEGFVGGGNIDPAGIFKDGTVEEVKEKTWELLHDIKEYKNFIISSGCDIPPGTPIENMDAFYETVKNFNENK